MPTEEELSQEQDNQEVRQRIRRALNNAYAFVRGRESVNSFTAYTFEDALDDQIERIEGSGTVLRPNEKERVERIYKDVLAAAEDVEEYSGPSVSDEENVNTPKDA